MKGFLTNEQRIEICEFRAKHPKLSYKEIAEKMGKGYTEREVFNAVHMFPEISGILKNKRIDDELAKRIAIWKSNHPETTLAELEKKFGVPTHVARYAIQKFSGEAELAKSTKRGRINQSKIIARDIDQVESLKRQLNFVIAELENNNTMVVSSRVELLYKLIRIRVFLQDLEIEAHIKRVDADVIAMIIRRFVPEATSDDIIKIYTEEFHKWQTHKGQQAKGI